METKVLASIIRNAKEQAMLRDETNIKGRGELGNHIKSNIHTLIWLSYPFNL